MGKTAEIRLAIRQDTVGVVMIHPGSGGPGNGTASVRLQRLNDDAIALEYPSQGKNSRVRIILTRVGNQLKGYATFATQDGWAWIRSSLILDKTER